MLPSRHRLRTPHDFAGVLRRRGRDAGPRLRVGGPLLVVQLAGRELSERTTEVPRVGLAVSRAVGTAVVRNRVQRRLRALAAARLSRLHPGTDVVIRALPAAAGASFDDLGRELDRALDQAASRRDGLAVPSPVGTP